MALPEENRLLRFYLEDVAVAARLGVYSIHHGCDIPSHNDLRGQLGYQVVETIIGKLQDRVMIRSEPNYMHRSWVIDTDYHSGETVSAM